MTQQQEFANSFNNQWDEGAETFSLTTSGTTGNPKPWILHRSALEWSANSTRLAWLQDISLHQYCFLPTWKAGGFMQLVRSKVWRQPIEIFEPQSNPLLTVKPNGGLASFTPMQLTVILSDPLSLKHLNRLDAVLIGGQSLTPELEQSLPLRCPHPRFIVTFGSTETASHFAGKVISNGNHPTAIPIESHYRATPGTRLRANPFTHQLEINNPTTQSQWLTTNDIVEMLDETSFNWIGRKDLIINTGGIKVHIEPLESQISILTGWPLGSFFIHGKSDAVLGEKIALKTLHNVDQEQLEFWFSCLPNYHQPKEIEIVNRIPITETGKIQRIKPEP